MMRTFSAGQPLRRLGMPAMVVAVLLASGCGGGSSAGQHASTMSSGAMKSMSPTPAPGEVLSLTGTEYSFAPMAMVAKAGRTTIRFTNKGAMEHDFTIDSLKVHLSAQPGKSAEVTVVLKPGTYQSHCAVPGHSQSGMHGTLTVS
jgi:uncharacterized cupredoxin-like copper-binding protein